MTRLSVALVVTSLMCGLPGMAFAQSLDERFNAANASYVQKNYREAKAQYIEIRDRYQVNDAPLHYNLGNSYFQLEQWGHAVLSYKRALAASPDDLLDASIRNNLAMTMDALVELHRKDISKSVTVLDETHGIAYSVFHLMSENSLAWLFLVLWSLFFLVVLARRLYQPFLATFQRALLFILGPATLIAGILFIGNLSTGESVVRGVVVERSVRMREGRKADSTLSDVPEGLEVRVIDDSDPQDMRIELSNGKQGWVSSGAVERI